MLPVENVEGVHNYARVLKMVEEEVEKEEEKEEKEDVARVENVEGVHNFARGLKMVEEEEAEEWRLHYGDGSPARAYLSQSANNRSSQYNTNGRNI